MHEVKWRLECLRYAFEHGGADGALERARVYYNFIIFGLVPAPEIESPSSHDQAGE